MTVQPEVISLSSGPDFLGDVCPDRERLTRLEGSRLDEALRSSHQALASGFRTPVEERSGKIESDDDAADFDRK